MVDTIETLHETINGFNTVYNTLNKEYYYTFMQIKKLSIKEYDVLINKCIQNIILLRKMIKDCNILELQLQFHFTDDVYMKIINLCIDYNCTFYELRKNRKSKLTTLKEKSIKSTLQLTSLCPCKDVLRLIQEKVYYNEINS